MTLRSLHFNAETRRTRSSRGDNHIAFLRAFSVFSASPRLVCLALAAVAAHAAVTGTVINRTTGKPQAGATVGLNKLGMQNGIELIDQAKSDAQGRFTIDQSTAGQTPFLIRTAFDGVTYNHMLPPGSPTTDLTLDVYSAAKASRDAKVAKHMLLFEPAAGQVNVSETLIVKNPGTVAWNDPDQGTVRFSVPEGAGKPTVRATAPGGAPIGAAVIKTSKPGVFAVDFPVKPGDSQFDITYTAPYTAGEPYSGKIVTNDENTYLIAPNGITLAGDGLNDLGVEPRSQAHIYGLQADAYKITLTGEEAPRAAAPDSGEQSDASGPQIQEIMPRVNDKAKLILGLALGILALGFVLLYRHSPKESNARGRS